MPKSRFKRHKLLITGLFFIVLLIIAIIALYSTFSKPVSVSVSAKSVQSSVIDKYNIDLTPVPESDKYVSFEYPKGLKLQSTSLLNDFSVADYTFYVKDVYSWLLAIDVSNQPTGQLSRVSAYTYRLNNPGEYKQQNEVINGREVMIFSDSDFDNGFSKVAFLTDGNLVATISLYGDDTSGTLPLQKSFDLVIDSWQWH